MQRAAGGAVAWSVERGEEHVLAKGRSVIVAVVAAALSTPLGPWSFVVDGPACRCVRWRVH